MDIEYNPKFENFFSCVKRYAVLRGGAGSGKSHAVGQKIITRCFQEKHRVLIIRKIKNTLRESVFKLIKDHLSDYGITSQFVKINNTELSFKFANGSEIITTGLDDVEKLKSITGITMIWIEEATELEEYDLAQIDMRMRGITPFYKQIIISFNPISEDHWLKSFFYDEENEDVFLHHSTFLDNNFLDDQYKGVLVNRYSKDPNLNRIYIKGEWGRVVTGQEFYKQFSYEKHVKPCLYDPELPLHISFDFNVNPYMPLSIWQIHDINGKMKCCCIDEIAAKNPDNDTERVCELFSDKYPNSQVYYYGDASGRAKSTTSRIHNYDIIEEVLVNHLSNYSARVPRRNPLVAQRRMFVNGILDDRYDIEIVIDPNCKYMITDLENVLESPDGGKHKKMAKDPRSKIPYEKYGHFSDTFDYLFCSAFETIYTNFQKK